jgi:hypothetical protein
VQNLTESIFTRDDWQALQPATIDGYAHDGRYFGFNPVTGNGFCMDPSVPAFYTLTMNAVAGFQDLKTDKLYLLPNGLKGIVKWEGNTVGAYFPFTWRSKIFVLPQAINFAVAQVEGQNYPLTFRLFVDGTLRHTQTVANEAPFRLPAGYRGKEVMVELAGSATVSAVYVATSVTELAGV